MKPRTKKAFWIALVVSILSLFIIYQFLPYPPWMYFDAKKRTVYSPAWPISETEYVQIKAQVEKELKGFEIIDFVDVKSDSEIEIWTLEYWKGPLAAGGQIFHLKKVNGRWERQGYGSWVS